MNDYWNNTIRSNAMPPLVKKQQPPKSTTTPKLTQTSPSETNAQQVLRNGDVWGNVDCTRLLLYGDAGRGKTTFWSTFPGPIKALICSGGTKPGELRSVAIADRAKITPCIINTLEDLDEQLKDLDKYVTVVLDRADGYQDLAIMRTFGIEVGQKPPMMQKGVDTGAMWRRCNDLMFQALRALLNAPRNVVIVTGERLFTPRRGEDGEEVIPTSEDVIKPVIGAALTPGVASWLNRSCDEVLQAYIRPKMEVRNIELQGKTVPGKPTRVKNEYEYCLRTGPHDIYMTKIRVPRGSPPPECIVDPDYTKMMKLIRGEK